MIKFRCWYCNKAFMVAESRIGEQITCSCKRLLRVPKKNNGYCRVKTMTDRIVETVVYGGAGALLGLGLSLVIMSQWRPVGLRTDPLFVVGLVVVGFLGGLFGGEPAINWIGRMIRDREKP